MQSDILLSGERIDDLQRNGLQIIQSAQGFRFGMDAVLLADFVRLRPREKWADFGTGTGILPILLSQNEPTVYFEAMELQPQMAEMAGRSVRLNHLQDRIKVHAVDIRLAPTVLGYETLDGVVCNPPYGKRGCVLPSQANPQNISRHETESTIEDFVCSAAKVLRNHGRLCMVFPSSRMLELMDFMRKYALEPKRLRMVCAKASKPPYLILVEAIKMAKPALLWMPPLIIYHEDGSETTELRRIYHQETMQANGGEVNDG